MVVTPSGMLMDVKPALLNAPLPIFFTLSGIVTEVKFVQPAKAYCAMYVTPSGIA